MENIFRIITISSFLITFSCTNSKAKQNLENVRKIRVGMIYDSVRIIMGKEDEILEGDKTYITDDDSYPFISFDYDSLNRVSRIYSPTNAKQYKN